MGSVSTNGQGAALPKVWRADSAWERGRGLLARAPLEWGQGFWIEPCASVHTAFMGYALDLAFVDSEGVIRKLAQDVKPWRMAGAVGARATLEMKSGQLARSNWRVGDHLSWQPTA